MSLDVQISWQAQHLLNLEVQISWQAQHLVSLTLTLYSLTLTLTLSHSHSHTHTHTHAHITSLDPNLSRSLDFLLIDLTHTHLLGSLAGIM